MTEHLIGYQHLAIAALLVLADAALSLLLKLSIARTLLVSACRMVVQLLLVGLVLRYVFALSAPILVAAVAVAMTAAASFEIYSRQVRRL